MTTADRIAAIRNALVPVRAYFDDHEPISQFEVEAAADAQEGLAQALELLAEMVPRCSSSGCTGVAVDSGLCGRCRAR